MKNRNVLFASGLTEEQVEQVMESDRPVETANSILAREMETDPEGLWERRAKQSQQLKDEGKVLFLTGAVAQAEVPELQLAYAAAWQEFTDKGILPSVTENEDGTFHVVQKGRYGEKDLDMTLTADAADAFVADAIRQLEDRELKLRQQKLGKKAEMPNLRGALQENVATIAGEAMARRTQEQGRFDVEDVAKQVPESIGRMIRANGSINRTIAERITDWAQGEIQALVAGGMDYKAAAASRDYAAGAVRSLGDWTSFAAGFTERAGQVGDVDTLGTTLFRSQTSDEVLVDGARVLGSALFGVRGRMSGLNVLEDVTESVLDQMVQARAVHMVEQDSTMSRQEAEAKAWDELDEVVSRARAAVLKADPKVKVVEVKKGNKMSVIEAFSDISNSAFLTSGVVPKWMGPMAETMKANVTAANAAMTLAEAWNAAIEQDPNAVAAMRDILDKVGVEVGEVLADTTITATDVEAWKTARAVARAEAYGPNGSGGDAVSEVVAEAEAEEAAILEAEKPASKEYVEEAKEEVRQQEEHAEQVFQPEPGEQVEEPKEVQGVFVGGYCVYNAAGGYYMGLVDKSQLRDGIEQVKVGAKGKHGVIAGRELVGNFQSSAAPLYVWKRTSGELWLISGRHRFELMLRDNGVKSHPCYVFVEDAEHDEKWARMMDYENNMRDDQADEVTAAMYVRETGYSDAELLKRGLLRNASRSKRGALIGRHAREELWTRFTNGAIKPMDAEIICNLTKNIKDQSRVEEIQRRCCMLLADGKSWDFIGGMVQLMANKESITLKQGLLDLGADFEADLARAAAWIEKSLGKIKESISLLKQGRKLSGKKREEAERLGIVTATQEGAEEMLRDLEMLRGKYEMIGSYPDLVAQAQMWDGKTEVDPVGLYLERVQAEREQARAEGELDADAYLEEQARKAAAEAVPTLSFSMGAETYTTRVLSKAYGTDSNGNKLSADTFITTPMGNVDWYRFPQDEKTQKLLAKHGVKNLPIRLRVGKQNRQEHRGFGFIHILRHFDDMKAKGESPLLHLYHTLSNLVKIQGQGYGRYTMKAEYEGGHDSKLIVQLMEDDGCYSIVSCYPESMNRIPQRGELVIGRALFQFIPSSKETQIHAGKTLDKTTTSSVGANGQVSGEKISQTAHRVNIYDLQIRNANGEVIFQQGVEPKVTFSMTPEMESIKAEAVAAGTFMKAPNGKATNLTELQWLQVRTAAFKRWFGDWENDPANASKVVDENGEPLVVYHGARHAGFRVFDNEEGDRKSDAPDGSNFFSSSRSVAYSYAGRYDEPDLLDEELQEEIEEYGISDMDAGIYEVFLNIRDPYVFDFKGRNWEPEEYFYSLVDERGDYITPTNGDEYYNSREEAEERAKALGLEEYEVYTEYKNTNIVAQEAMDMDCDGAIIENVVDEGRYGYGTEATDYIVFSSAQVKSATQNRGTFDGSNPDITFSVGEERNLAAVHSLSPEKFLAALELGGMPMPSVAVTRLDKPYSWGGADAINLVGRPEMVDPRKKSKVYMHDAYTGKMPTVMYRKKNREGAMKLKDEALKAIEPYGMDASDGLQSGLFSQDYNESVVDGYYADWGNNRAMRAYWAITQAGYAPKPKMKEAAGVMSAALYKVLKPWEKMLPKNEVLFSYDFTEEILEAFREVMVGHFEAEGKEKLADKYRKMELRDLQGQALDKAMGVRRYTTKKVPDGVENWKRFDAYVSKHAKAYKAWCDEQMRKFLGEKVFSRKFERKNWRGEVVDEWWGHEAYNLKNLMRYMREEKSRGGETESMSPGLFLAVVSEELRSLKDIQAKREQVVGAEAHQDARAVYGQAYNEFVRLTYELKKPGWGGYFEISDAALWRLLELVQGGRNMPTREAVERKLNESKDGWTDKHVDAAMDLLSKVLSMPSDYMEAVPQRAVKMDEWEYAVMPVSLKKNKAVMAGLRENGIRPRFHDGTEEGRWAALAGLVNDRRVSFSVVGENAANWDELKERAFRGRDDGKLRVEIDASQAKLKGALDDKKVYQLEEVLDFPELYKAYPRLKRAAVDVLGLEGNVLGLAYHWRSVIELDRSLLNNPEELRSVLLHEVQHLIQGIEGFAKGGHTVAVREKVEAVLESLGYRMDALARDLQWLSGVEVAKDYLKEARKLRRRKNAWKYSGLMYALRRWGESAEETRERMIQDIARRYEAFREQDNREAEYREMTEAKLPKVYFHDIASIEQALESLENAPSRKMAHRGEAAKKSRKLKELVQRSSKTRRVLEKFKYEPYELYLRLAGEIEARNVQLRMDWTAEERAARPFNDTLEYPGEALVTFSVEEVTADWQNTLRGYLNNPPAPGSPEHARDMVVSPTPAVMQMVGAKGWDMVITPGVLDKVMKGKHAVSKEALEQLPAAVSDPICIAVSDTPGCLEVVTELKEGADNVLVAVQLNSGSVADKNIKVNRIASMYGKERIRNLLTHPMVYWNKAKARPWLHNYRLQLPATINPKPGYRGTILKPADLVKYKEERNLTYSMTEMAQNALLLLESRRDEVEAQVILEDMQKACERLSIVLAGNDDPKLGAGLQVYAEMQALISATRRALPEKYLRQGNLNGLLAWAGVYARMAQTGQMPKRGAIKGEIYDRFVRELSRKNELMQLQGMSEAEAREVMMDLGSAKLETAFLKVGRDCSQRLDAFLKDRALERINWLYKTAYPTREEGQAWTRGKMASEAYRLVEKVMTIIGRSHEQRSKVDEEILEVRREQRKIRQAMESGQMTEDMGKRKLDVLRGRIDRLEAEAMATAADEHAKRLEELNRQIEELEDGEQKEAQESILAEEMALVQTFGNWYYKGAGDAVRAARVFEDIVMRGKTDWEDKLKLERERRAYLKAMIAANFDVADEDVENVRAGDRAAFKGKMGSKVKALGKGLMSMGHLLLALRPKMGRTFCDEQRAKLARINEGFMAFNMELDGWMYRTIRNITGIDSKERQKVWMNQMEEIKDTGIFITNRRTEKIVLTYAEAVAWLNMDKESRAKERERVMTEAAQEKRKPQNVPTEEVMDELGELVQAYEKDKRGVEEDRKKFHLTHEVTWEEELRTTKGVLLFYLLTFEQPDYEHLMEVNGVSGATLDQMRRYIGPQMMKWGYAMREKLNEHGVLVADAFEAYTGIPFGSRELYFKGVFDRGPMKERDEKAAVEQGSAAAGTRTKYGSLIPRRYHKAKVERVSATQVFVQAMQQQNNYVQTAEYVREWRGLLSDKDFAKRLEAELGAATMQILNGWIGVLEGAAAGDAAAARAATGIINRMLGGYAVTRLAGNIKTLIKQGSAILNGFAGGYVPEAVVKNGKLVQEMAYRKLGLGEFMMALGRVLTFRGAVKKNMVAGQEYIAGRRDYEGKGLAATAMMEADQKVAGYVPEGGFLGWSKIPQQFWSWLGAKSAKATELAMEAMGYVDSEMCAVSAMAVADAVYRQGKAEDKAGMVPNELLRAEALRIAGMALDIAAQPQVRTQKGYWAASGAFGAMGQFLYMFRSDTLQKVGLWEAQMTSGEKLPAAVGWISFGLLNSVIAELLVMLYGDLPDDDEELSEHALTFALNVLLGDVSALPVIGEAVGTVRNMVEGKHWAAQGGIGEAVVPVVTLGSDVYREWRNIEKDAPVDKHWATVARLLRSLGATAAFYNESTTGALANMSSVAAAAAVAGNASTLFKGILKVIEDMED